MNTIVNENKNADNTSMKNGLKNCFISKVEEASAEESEEILSQLAAMSDDELTITKIEKITV